MILDAGRLSASGRPELAPGEVELLLVDQVWLWPGLTQCVHATLDFDLCEGGGSEGHIPHEPSTRLLDTPPE